MLKDSSNDFIFGLAEDVDNAENAVIRVIGVGGGGGNAVQHMVNSDLSGVEFIAANTDAKALRNLNVSNKLTLGHSLTKGLGAGSDPERGMKAAVLDKEKIQKTLAGSDLVFITAGMGGGTGTGGAPIVAEIAKSSSALTVAVVTSPFIVEGKRKQKIAEQGIEALAENVDALIIVPNQKLLKTQKQLSLIDAYALSNNVLHDAVRGISELITKPGMMGLDFADVRTAMQDAGASMVGCGFAKSSPNAAREACMSAIKNPLLEDANLKGAKGVLANITGGENLTVQDFEDIGQVINDFAADDAVIKIGTAFDTEMNEGIRVTIVATSIEYKPVQENTESVKNLRQSTQAPRKIDLHYRDQWAHKGRNAEATSESILDNPPRSTMDVPAFLRRRQMD